MIATFFPVLAFGGFEYVLILFGVPYHHAVCLFSCPSRSADNIHQIIQRHKTALAVRVSYIAKDKSLDREVHSLCQSLVTDYHPDFPIREGRLDDFPHTLGHGTMMHCIAMVEEYCLVIVFSEEIFRILLIKAFR